MRYSLNKKVVFITGAAGGIGAAVAQQLYAKGASLILTDLDASALAATAQTFAKERALTLPLDVTDTAACRDAVAKAIQQFGKLDIVFANAGIAWQTSPATILSCDSDEFENIIAVDTLGVWRTVKACLPEIVKQQGQVLVTSSIYAMINGTANAPYAASKAAVESFTRALRVELAHTGASASVVYPGWVDTPITDIAFGGDALATEMIQTALPALLRRPIPAEVLAKTIIAGMEKRKPHIIAPKRWRPVFWLRGVINPVTDSLLTRHPKLRTLITKLEQSQPTHIKQIKTGPQKNEKDTAEINP